MQRTNSNFISAKRILLIYHYRLQTQTSVDAIRIHVIYFIQIEHSSMHYNFFYSISNIELINFERETEITFDSAADNGRVSYGQIQIPKFTYLIDY